jgi:crotonobetainyl-CoA:carnitine CoA-transferase CaiB-like acyl-CoA transferase
MLPTMTETTPRKRRLELAATLLLALATVATAWSAYQARQWTSEQAQGYSHATADRLAGNRLSATANTQTQIDVATFVQWVDARAQNRPELVDFYRARFRDEFKPAFAAWLATRPFADAAAPPTPFAMPAYTVAAQEEADRLEATAAAGISTRLEEPRSRIALLALGWLVFSAAPRGSRRCRPGSRCSR